MKTLISILIVLLSIQEVTAQKNTARKDFLSENPVAKEQNKAKKRYVAKVRLMNGMRLTGLVIRTTQDSVTILNNRSAQPIRMGASEIESIKIRGKGSIGRRLGIGAGTGFILGGIIGYGSYTRVYTCNGCGFFDDFFQAEITVLSAIAGGGAGLFVGAMIGAALEKEYIIDGSQARFGLFVSEFRK